MGIWEMRTKYWFENPDVRDHLGDLAIDMILLKWTLNWGNSVQKPGCGLDDRGSIPTRGSDGTFHRVQTSSEAHPTSCPVDIAGSYPRGNAAGAWSWPLTSPQFIFMAWCLVKYRVSPVGVRICGQFLCNYILMLGHCHWGLATSRPLGQCSSNCTPFMTSWKLSSQWADGCQFLTLPPTYLTSQL